MKKARGRRVLTGREKMGFLVAVAAVLIAFVALIPAGNVAAQPTYEGGGCDGCHGDGGTSIVTVTGLPVGTYNPSQAYVLTITVADANGAGTGENAFDILVSAGTLTETDDNAEINAAGLEASSNDAGDLTVNTWTVTWTAPASGSVTIDVWGVYGDGTSPAVDDLYEHESYNISEIPEFPMLVLPVVGALAVVLGVAAVRRRKQ